MAKESSPKQIIAEDDDLSNVFLAVMRRHVPGWPPQAPEGAPVWVRTAGSAQQAFVMASVVWKMTNLATLGILVDAEDNFASRWARIKSFAQSHFPSVPTSMPEEGLILSNSKGQKFGAWVMPDNKSSGMLETFCRPLIPAHQESLWEYALEAANEAKNRGAGYITHHVEKAYIHTYLAWMNPPGQRIGQAVASNCLDCCSESAAAFVKWSRDLYGL